LQLERNWNETAGNCTEFETGITKEKRTNLLFHLLPKQKGHDMEAESEAPTAKGTPPAFHSMTWKQRHALTSMDAISDGLCPVS